MPEPLADADEQLALGRVDLDAVDGEPDVASGTGRGSRSAVSASGATSCGGSGELGQLVRVATAGCSMKSRNSWRKYLMALVIGLVAPSPSAQNERPRMLSQMSSSVSRSALGALPASIRSRICTSQ